MQIVLNLAGDCHDGVKIMINLLDLPIFEIFPPEHGEKKHKKNVFLVMLNCVRINRQTIYI